MTDARKHLENPAPEATGSTASGAPAPVAGRSRLLVGLAVALLFAVIIGVSIFDRQTAPSASDAGAPGGTTPDPVAALDAALEGQKPILVLFHSSSCAPCLEIEQVVERVMPEYADAVVYVDAPTDDSRTGPLFAQFSFQYIPTSFFLTPKGDVFDSYTGVLTDDQMRQRLDALVAAAE